MGEKSVKLAVEPEQQQEVLQNILKDIHALEKMIDKGLVDENRRIGVEQEIFLIDQAYRPSPLALDFLKEADDDHFQTELALFNIEINLDPLQLSKNCFSQLHQELQKYLKKAAGIAKNLDNHIALTGILPTIQKTDLELDNLTPQKRQRALMAAMHKLRQENYDFRIEGIDDLVTKDTSNMYQSCNTSFQVHYQAYPDEFIDLYNFAQLISAPVLAAATNSPLLLNKRLWHETRIAWFMQAVDTRTTTYHLSEEHHRVPFGKEWVSGSVPDLFEDDISSYKIFFQHTVHENASALLEQGKTPELKALTTYNSTIFKWNRPCYGITNGKPHLRIENRYLPSGPTLTDEAANAAFWAGLLSGFSKKYKNLPDKLPFETAKNNFIKAARYGLESQFQWLNGKSIAADKLILNELLPLAEEGLKKAKIYKKDIDKYLGIIEKRVKGGRTGSKWMLESFNSLAEKYPKQIAATAITVALVENQKSDKPVHEWQPISTNLKGYTNIYNRVDQVMTTDIYAASEDDLIDFAANYLYKHNIRNLPVEDEEGNLTGLVTSMELLHHYGLSTKDSGKIALKDIMIKNPVTTTPDTPTLEALEVMKKENLHCLPVVKEKKLVGILTGHDFLNIAQHYLIEKKRSKSGKSN